MAGGLSGGFGVGSWIERRARSAPDDVALITEQGSLTYAELARRIRRLANGLRGLGVAKGDRVAWLGPNHPAFLESLFAAGLVGAALAPVNHRLQPEEIGWVLEDIEPSVLIHHRTDLSRVSSAVPHRVTVEDGLDGEASVEELVAATSEDAIDEAVGEDDLCMLPHTSGTTGRPKGVMLTHGNMTWNVVNFITCADFRGDDVTVAIAPFFRVGGTGVNVLPVLFLGGTVVVLTDVTADTILSAIERHRVTVGFGNPDILEAMAGAPAWPSADLSTVRFIVTGGAPVPERLIRTFLDRGVTMLQGYGLSEAGPLALLLDPDSAIAKVGSAGRPALLVDVRIETGSGEHAVPGETGELLVRGPNVMAGYWRRPDATREVMTVDGWLRTGDAARSDKDGFLWIVDRVHDRFVSDGQQVYPGDVERVLARHPAVADAGVVGIPAHPNGEVGVAFVAVRAGVEVAEEELIAFCQAGLSEHQVPVAVRFVAGLPRNSVGKLNREALRAIANGPPVGPPARSPSDTSSSSPRGSREPR